MMIEQESRQPTRTRRAASAAVPLAVAAAENAAEAVGAPPAHASATPARLRAPGGKRRTQAEISAIMRRVHSDGTSPELRLRQALADVDVAGIADVAGEAAEGAALAATLPGKPDLVFADARLVVFVDGDLWHGNQWRRRGLTCLEEQFRATPARAYWLRKIRRNMRRDAVATAALLAQGWSVIRLWESQINADLAACVTLIRAALAPAASHSAGPAAAVQDAQTAWGAALAPQTCAEFFAGIGLMRMGLEHAGWSVVFANDIDERKHAMYRQHFGAESAEPDNERDGAEPTAIEPIAAEPAPLSPSHTYGKGPGVRPGFLLGDIHTIPAEGLPTTTLATASFPCNDLSLAGARAGLVGAQSSAFWGFIRILRELGARRPPLILLENVVGFLSSHGGADLAQALAALNDLGYLVDACILDAAHFTPQSRQRLFIVGTQAALVGDADVVDVADVADAAMVASEEVAGATAVGATAAGATAAGARVVGVRGSGARGAGAPRPPALLNFIAAHPELRWRIRRLPPLPTSERTLVDILEDLPDDAPQWWSVARTRRLLDQMTARHRALAEELIAGDAVRYGTVFRRTRQGVAMAELRADGVAGCLRTPRGGSARQIVFKGGHGRAQARLLTGREAARLMGADDYTLTVSLNDALFGFGDAVCVPVVSWLATYYLNPLVNELLRGRLLTPPA